MKSRDSWLNVLNDLVLQSVDKIAGLSGHKDRLKVLLRSQFINLSFRNLEITCWFEAHKIKFAVFFAFFFRD